MINEMAQRISTRNILLEGSIFCIILFEGFRITVTIKKNKFLIWGPPLIIIFFIDIICRNCGHIKTAKNCQDCL